MSRKVMQQALDALNEYMEASGGFCGEKVASTIAALQASIAQPEPEPYDQQSLEPCDVCGWKAIVPGEPCLMCERNARMNAPEPLPDGCYVTNDASREAALSDAVLAEREACAATIEALNSVGSLWCAEAIRARSKQ